MSAALAAPHRADIEGLRGIAVLSVFAVHSIPHVARGGFVGVDVFFVISGYLITLLSLPAMDEGRFGMRDFWARRIRRIVPALQVVLLTCLAFAALFAFPREVREIGKHAAGGAGFVSNLVLWTEAGYFDRASESKPLLHLWSLGIEEQFYLLWPLAALAMAPLRRRAFWLVLAALLASFALNAWFVGEKPKGTFFLPMTRFWELLVGVALAYAVHYRMFTPPSGARALGLATLGVLLIAASVGLIDKTDHFPGAWALLPTLGTAALISAGPSAWPNRVVLGHPIMQFYGRISFSLYLWHWPLLVLPTLVMVVLSTVEQLFVLGGAVVLAAATHRWVEQPGRRSARAPFTVPWLLGSLVAVAVAGWALFRSDGMLWRYPAELQPVAAVHGRDDYRFYRIERCFLRSEQPPQAFADECGGRPESGAPADMLLWGDSFAAALYPGLAEHVTAAGGTPVLAQYTAAACPPLSDPMPRVGPLCAQVHADVLRRIRERPPRTVVLAAHWSGYAHEPMYASDVARSVRRTVSTLRGVGVKDIVVVGPAPVRSVPVPSLVLSHWREHGSVRARSDEYLIAGLPEADAALRESALAEGARYLSLLGLLCSLEGCRVTLSLPDGEHAIAFDELHLTRAGSLHVGRSLADFVLSSEGEANPRH